MSENGGNECKGESALRCRMVGQPIIFFQGPISGTTRVYHFQYLVSRQILPQLCKNQIDLVDTVILNSIASLIQVYPPCT